MYKHQLFLCLFCSMYVFSFAQNSPKPNPLIGRWEVLQYAEQGLQVDKKQPAAPQALAVYRHVQKTRAKTWYGFDYDYADEYSRRRSREFQRWEERDSIQEVKRITDAIQTPFFAVFFPDSTLALYNKDAASGQVSFPESRHYVFSQATMSMDVYPPGVLPPSSQSGGWTERMDIQILLLTETNMTLFIPEEGEIVTLVKTAFVIP
ncbi:MAG TPA: hypothetical protein VK168_20180 [Saprospiraceae bacterium]|nr:hypothetical protein [Saprospiraceae bacterium]